MQANISQTVVKDLEPRDRPYEVRDTGLRGFLLRVQPSGMKTYYVEFGRGQRMRIGRTDTMKAKAARDKALQILATAQAGEDPRSKVKRTDARTFREFADKIYAPWAEAHLKRPEQALWILRTVFGDFRNRRLDQLTPFEIERWRSDRRRDGCAASSVNRYMDTLKACLEKAVAWGYLKTNPANEIKRLKDDRDSTPRYLSEGEYKALLQALDAREAEIRRKRASANAWRRERGRDLLPSLENAPYVDHLKPLVLLSLNTGLRRGEALALEWGAIDLDRSLLTVRAGTAKSGKTRHIPLNRSTREMLAAWREWCGPDKRYVFEARAGKPLKDARTSWEQVLKAAGIANFRWHDMRHTFASWLVMRGVDLNTVRELLGHSNYAMTLRYAHLAPEVSAAAVERLPA